MTETLVSVVVVPREGFRRAPARLAQLLDVTDTAFRLVYVEAMLRHGLPGESDA